MPGRLARPGVRPVLEHTFPVAHQARTIFDEWRAFTRHAPAIERVHIRGPLPASPNTRAVVQTHNLGDAERLTGEADRLSAVVAIGPQTESNAAALSKLGGKCVTYGPMPLLPAALATPSVSHLDRRRNRAIAERRAKGRRR